MSSRLSESQAQDLIQRMRDGQSPEPTEPTMMCGQLPDVSICHDRELERCPWSNRVVENPRSLWIGPEEVLPHRLCERGSAGASGDAGHSFRSVLPLRSLEEDTPTVVLSQEGSNDLTNSTPGTVEAAVEVAPSNMKPSNPTVELPPSPSPSPSPSGRMTLREAQNLLDAPKRRGRPTNEYKAKKETAEKIVEQAWKLNDI